MATTRHLTVAQSIALALIFIITKPAYSLDIFSYMSQPDKPISFEKPCWLVEDSRLRFSYEVNETYKKWLDNSKEYRNNYIRK